MKTMTWRYLDESPSGLGRQIIIRHADGTESTYETSDDVHVGDTVTIPSMDSDETLTGVVTEII